MAVAVVVVVVFLLPQLILLVWVRVGL